MPYLRTELQKFVMLAIIELEPFPTIAAGQSFFIPCNLQITICTFVKISVTGGKMELMCGSLIWKGKVVKPNMLLLLTFVQVSWYKVRQL